MACSLCRRKRGLRMMMFEMMMVGVKSITTSLPVKSRQAWRYITATDSACCQLALRRRNVQQTMLLYSNTYRLNSILNEFGRPIALGQSVRGGIRHDTDQSNSR